MAKSRFTNEFTVLGIDSISGNAKTISQHSQKNWDSVSLKTLAKKLNQARQSSEYLQGGFVKVEVHFLNGSLAIFTFIPKHFTLFQTHEALRDSLSRPIRESGNISFNLMFMNEDSPWKQESLVDALSSLVVLNQWVAPTYGTTKAQKRKMPSYGFYTHLATEIVQEIIRESEIKSRATNQARTLAMMPSNKLDSKALVDFSLEVAKKLKISSRFISVSELEQIGAGAFCAVLQGSESEGGIVVLRRPGKTKEIILVGKGVTFDTGGHDLKTDSSMFGMHRDMTGAAVALSAFEALVNINPNLSLSCYLAIGENMISEKAYRPGDVITSLSGLTIERVSAATSLALAGSQGAEKHNSEATMKSSFLTSRC